MVIGFSDPRSVAGKRVTVNERDVDVTLAIPHPKHSDLPTAPSLAEHRRSRGAGSA